MGVERRADGVSLGLVAGGDVQALEHAAVVVSFRGEVLTTRQPLAGGLLAQIAQEQIQAVAAQLVGDELLDVAQEVLRVHVVQQVQRYTSPPRLIPTNALAAHELHGLSPASGHVRVEHQSLQMTAGEQSGVDGLRVSSRQLDDHATVVAAADVHASALERPAGEREEGNAGDGLRDGGEDGELGEGEQTAVRDDVVDDVEKRGLEGDGGHHVGAQKSGAEEELALG